MEAMPTTTRAGSRGRASELRRLLAAELGPGETGREVAVSALLAALSGNAPVAAATCRANHGRAAKAATAAVAPSSNHSAARLWRGRTNSKLCSSTGVGATVGSAATNG